MKIELRLLALALSGGAALALSAGAEAQVYKCVDASGKVVYAQSPCPKGAKSTTIRSDPPAAAPAAKAPDGKAAGPQTAAEQDMEFRKRQKEKADAEKKASEESAQAKEQKDNCARAKEQVAALQVGGRMSRVNAQGERYFLSDEELAQEKSRAEAQVTQLCK